MTSFAEIYLENTTFRRGKMIINTNNIVTVIELMDVQLRNELFVHNGELQTKKLWENTYIKHQIDKRKQSGEFSLTDNIRAMVYSMVSAGMAWERVERGIDEATGRILPIDEIFFQYEPNAILQCSPEKLRDDLKGFGCATSFTLNQMKALIGTNIPKLLQIEEQYGSIDGLYQKFIDEDSTLKSLVKALSDRNSEYKFAQMEGALVAEYLKNIGYEIAKPDRHIRRILGSDILGLSDRKEVPVYDSIDIVSEIAAKTGKSAAEVDYILWSYCATGYGEICTKQSPRCDICVAKQYCKKGNS